MGVDCALLALRPLRIGVHGAVPSGYHVSRETCVRKPPKQGVDKWLER